MFTKVKRFLASPSGSLVVLLALFYLLLATTLYLVIGKTARQAVEEQIQQQQQAAVRSGATGIQSFFNLFGESLAILTSGRLNQERLESFVESWRGTPIAGVIITDTQGTVVADAVREGDPDLGANVSDRDYFLWALHNPEGQFFVSKPLLSRLGASKGKYVVVVASPIEENGQFKGVLAASVVLEELSAQYLDQLKVSQASRIYLIDHEGMIIASPWQKLVGVNYFDYLGGNPFPGSGDVIATLTSVLEDKKEGQINLDLPNESTGKVTRFLIAHSPVMCNKTTNNKWTLAVATPVDDTAAFITPFYIRQIAVVAVGFIVLTVLIAILAKKGRLLIKH